MIPTVINNLLEYMCRDLKPKQPTNVCVGDFNTLGPSDFRLREV